MNEAAGLPAAFSVSFILFSLTGSCRCLKCSQPVRVIPGVFFGFPFQGISAKPYLFVKNGIDFILRNIASLL